MSLLLKSLKVPESLIYDYYDVKIKDYGNNRIEIFFYDSKIQYKNQGWELRENEIKKNNKKEKEEEKKEKEEEKKEEIRSDSLYRTYSNLVDLVLTNEKDFVSFITLTFKENITDLDFANYEFQKWTQRMKYKKKDFKFVAVPEFQKRGAVHYHILTNVKCDSDLIPKQEMKKLYNPDSKKNIVLEYYDLPSWKLGYSSAFDLLTTDDKFSSVKYLGKYFWKDIDNRLFGRRKILYSRNLKRPKNIKIKHDDIYNNKSLYKYLQIVMSSEYKKKRIEATKPYSLPVTIYKSF